MTLFQHGTKTCWFFDYYFIYISREAYRGKIILKNFRRLSAYLCVCLSVPRRISTLLHEPGCNLLNGRGAL